jgi:hypothetical protein
VGPRRGARGGVEAARGGVFEAVAAMLVT